MVHAFQLLFIDCNYPKAFVWWIGMHAVMFFFLFNEFYKSTYKAQMEVRINRLLFIIYLEAFMIVHVYLLKYSPILILQRRRERAAAEKKARELEQSKQNGSVITSLNSNGTIKKITENGHNHSSPEYSSKFYLQSNGNGTAELTYRNVQQN